MFTYLALFLTAFSTLALEITLVRLLSVTTWYHLAFFAISTSMLGMTAGATKVFLQPERFTPGELNLELAKQCFRFAVSVPFTLLLLCIVPMGFYANFMFIPCLLITTLACALPFYFAGIVIAVVLTKYRLPIGKLYSSDLIGASLGCLFVLGGLELFDAPSLILLCGGLAAVAGICFASLAGSTSQKRIGIVLTTILLLVGLLNSVSSRGIRPLIVKGKTIEPADEYWKEAWNSFSRISVKPPQKVQAQLWGPSPKAPTDLLEQYWMIIDGDAGTTVRRFNTLEDIDHLRYDVTNVAYHIRNGGPACIIGIGGGRDLQSALLFGCKPVTGVEINPIFVRLLKKEFSDFAGLAKHPDVDIVTAEARSYLTHTDKKFDVIQMSLIDTWAATGAGAFSLSENTLYTVEAWSTFLNRLTDNGLFTVSRWHRADDAGETSRVLSLAMATLFQMGAKNPADHIAMVSVGPVSTLILGRNPLSSADIEKIRQTCKEMDFEVTCLPGQPPTGALLQSLYAATSLNELNATADLAELNCSPTTDENPYFFNMLRLRNIGSAFTVKGGVIRGNLFATVTLVALMVTLAVVALVTIIVPLLLKRRSGNPVNIPRVTLWSGALYFSLIGAGFMLAEIGLIQRLTVLLSHPMYALGILLFTLIASTGLGSFLSDRLPLTKSPWIFVYPVAAAVAILAVGLVLNWAISNLIPAALWIRIVASIVAIFPIGLLLGMFFPTGMKLVQSVSPNEMPWYWALNGVFGVLCSALAVFISIYFGISTNFYIASICYAATVIAQVGLRPKSELTPVTASATLAAVEIQS